MTQDMKHPNDRPGTTFPRLSPPAFPVPLPRLLPPSFPRALRRLLPAPPHQGNTPGRRPVTQLAAGRA
jgi:hypothetical protein